MCTVLKNKHCIGRNFDYEESYKEEVIIVPKNTYYNKYSIIGICTGAVDDYPLLYDGANEHGLFCGGLAFEGNAKYRRYQDDKGNILRDWRKILKELDYYLQNPSKYSVRALANDCRLKISNLAPC